MFSATPVTCRFELTRPTRIYYSGDQVCGNITLTATKKVHFEGIFLNIGGAEHIQWSENDKNLPISYDDSSVPNGADDKIHFTGGKKYVLSSAQLSEAIELQPGELVIRFQLNLPDQFAPTCKQSNGYVDYHLQVILQRKTAMQKTFQKRLFLRNRIDLNMEPKLSRPHAIACPLLDNELIIIIPQTGYVPGQLIPLSIKIAQLLSVHKILINLCQKTSYVCQTPSAKTKEVIKVLDYYIATTAGSGVLRVPFTTAISTIMDNALMKVSYYVECLVLDGKLEIMHRTMIAITIGTVALRSRKKIVTDEIQRLHTYDNLGAVKEEVDECNNQKLVNFDFIACEAQRSFLYNRRILSLAGRKKIHRFWKKLCRKLRYRQHII